MIKVLVVITTAFTPTGGLTTVMLNYYRVINFDKIKMDFCSTNKIEDDLSLELKKRGSQYFRLPARKKIFSYVSSLKEICRGYDVVHINANSATATIELFAAKLAGVKIRLIHNHNSHTDYPILNKLLLPFYHRLYTKAIACSEEAGKWLYGNDFVILRNAINLERYIFDQGERTRIRERYQIKKEDVVIGHVGKFVSTKNHKFIIDIFSFYHDKNPHSWLLLVGDGVLHNEIISHVKELKLENAVIFAGLVQNVESLLQAMDVFVFPSLYEGMPLSVVEAQASGLPCITSTNVTDLVCIGKDVVRLDLEKGPRFWAGYILEQTYSDRQKRCSENYKLITEKGYNIRDEGENLQKLYENQ